MQFTRDCYVELCQTFFIFHLCQRHCLSSKNTFVQHYKPLSGTKKCCEQIILLIGCILCNKKTTDWPFVTEKNLVCFILNFYIIFCNIFSHFQNMIVKNLVHFLCSPCIINYSPDTCFWKFYKITFCKDDLLSFCVLI